MFMESGRHSANSLSTVTEEQEDTQGWDHGGTSASQRPRVRDELSGGSHSHSYACGLASLDSVRGN